MALEGLNNQQRKVVLHDRGPMLVVAGAGTGKTQVITRRIAYLITERNVAPQNILALTFTEKASREMADRLHSLVGWQSFQVPVLTFNAFGADILTRYATHVGRSIRGGLINDTQKALLIMRELTKQEFKYYGLQTDLYAFAQQLTVFIERLQNAGITSTTYSKYVTDLVDSSDYKLQADIDEQIDLAGIYATYDRLKVETGTFDYHDQLAIPLEILKARPNLALRLASEYNYVLVDEYQDTSPSQDALLRAIVPVDGNIMAVGDDDQAIYGFRGADVANILGFTDHFLNVKSVVLTENYRSGQPILDAAYRLIRHNDPDRLEVKLGLDKHLHAQTEAGTVEFSSYPTASTEQVSVSDQIKRAIVDGANPESIAILARTNAVLGSYAQSLRAHGVSFAISTEVNIFDQRELVNLWYLAEWLCLKARDEAIAHVIMGPFIGWTAARYREVANYCHDNEIDVEQALRAMAEEGNEHCHDLISNIDKWREWSAMEVASKLAYRLVFETGMSERLIELAKGDQQTRVLRVFEDLHLLLDHMENFESINPNSLMAGYLESFPLPPAIQVSEAYGDPDGVQLLTIHAAKGLEFDCVYIVGCTRSSWSERSHSGLRVPDELMAVPVPPAEHELRRLMYVAVTRAKNTLLLSSATSTAGGQSQSISPFMPELIGDLIATTSKTSKINDIDKLMQRLQRFYPLKDQFGDTKLPFENASGWIDLSVGSLESYDRCPHEFYLEKVLGISYPSGPQLTFGTSIHSVIQLYYESKLRNEEAGLADLLSRLNETWSVRGYTSPSMEASSKSRAVEIITRFFAREEEKQRGIMGSELKITLELPESKLRVRGRIDAFFKTETGIEIRDFKTGAKKNLEQLERDAKDSFQLRTYALAYSEMTGQLVSRVTLDYLATGVEGSAELSARILSNHREKLTKLAERIRARDFAPAAASDYHKCAAYKYYGNHEEDEI